MRGVDMDSRKLKVGDHVIVDTGINHHRRGRWFVDDSKPVLTGVVVGIGARAAGDLDTQVRVKLDSTGAQISAHALLRYRFQSEGQMVSAHPPAPLPAREGKGGKPPRVGLEKILGAASDLSQGAG